MSKRKFWFNPSYFFFSYLRYQKEKAAYDAGKKEQPITQTKNDDKKRKNESQNGKITKFLKKWIKRYMILNHVKIRAQ